MSRIVSEVLRSAGYAPTVSFSSWSLALERTQKGEVLGSFPFVGSEARRDQYLVSEPILDFEYVLFYSTRDWPSPPHVETAEDLRELRVGLIDGYDIWTELDEAVDEFIPFKSRAEAFSALDKGEIDLLPEGLLSGRAVVEGPDLLSGSADFGTLGEAGNYGLLRSRETLHFMMPRTPEAREVMRRFNSALASIQETEMFDRARVDLAPGEAGETVELVPADDSGLIELTDAADDSTILAPQGTQAMVLEWPDAFTDGEDDPSSSAPARVKVLNGPSAGRVVEVDPRSIHLTPPDD